MGFFAWLFKRTKPKKITLGLALGSGGAKGFAELGALKAFEENDIEFDVIAGTSIGSIIGAFYANGYSSTDMLEIMRTINFSDVATWLMVNMDTTALNSLLEKTIGEMTYEELKKPFRAIATEFESGDERVFSSGNVAITLCASSSMPPFFRPVTIDGVRYIDGAFSNSIPADVVREMGADFVCAIDLSTQESKQSIISKLIPTYKGKVENPRAKGYQFSDVMIHPNLENYKATSFRMWHEMYEIGYQTTIELIPKIKAEIQKLQKRK